MLILCKCRLMFGVDGVLSYAILVSETWSKGGASGQHHAGGDAVSSRKTSRTRKYFMHS